MAGGGELPERQAHSPYDVDCGVTLLIRADEVRGRKTLSLVRAHALKSADAL